MANTKIQKTALLSFTKDELLEAKEMKEYAHLLGFINNLLLFVVPRNEWSVAKVISYAVFIRELQATTGGYQCLN